MSAPRARDTCNTQNGTERVFYAYTPIPPPTDRQMKTEERERYISHYIFRSLHTLTPKPSVGSFVGDLSVVSTDGVSSTGHLSAFPTDTDRSPTYGADAFS